MDCYILHTFLLVTILLFIIAVTQVSLHKIQVKIKSYLHTTNIKMESNEFQKVGIKNGAMLLFQRHD